MNRHYVPRTLNLLFHRILKDKILRTFRKIHCWVSSWVLLRLEFQWFSQQKILSHWVILSIKVSRSGIWNILIFSVHLKTGTLLCYDVAKCGQVQFIGSPQKWQTHEGVEVGRQSPPPKPISVWHSSSFPEKASRVPAGKICNTAAGYWTSQPATQIQKLGEKLGRGSELCQILAPFWVWRVCVNKHY